MDVFLCYVSNYVSSYCDHYYYTPPLTIQCSNTSPITSSVMMAASSVGLATSGLHNVVLPPQLILRDTMRGSCGHTIMPQQQQPKSEMPSQAYTNYAMGTPQVSFPL